MTYNNVNVANENDTKGVDDTEQKRFFIIHQYTKDLSFENIFSATDFLGSKFNPTGQISFLVNAVDVQDDITEVTVKVKVESKDKDKTAYILEVEYAGLVSVSGFDDDEKRLIIMVEAPRLLFPYLRQIISNVTRDGGFQSLNLEPVDFLGLWLSNIEHGEK